MTRQPVRVAVTGAAGQIGYSLLFRIAAGDMLGEDQPVILQLLEITQALPALKGVVMELEDCAFPLLHEHRDRPTIATVAFRDVDVALLVGARPRSKGMERKDLLEANAQIFTVQGRALDEAAERARESARRRQSGEHECAHRDEECARPQAAAVHRHDAPGPQPRSVAGRREGR